MFYPDNTKRAARLQQLVDSMANMQTDIKHDADEMDQKNAAIRPTINALLKEKNIATIDDLINQSLAKMTPDEKKTFESLVEAAKKANPSYVASAVLMLPEAALITCQSAAAAGRFLVRIGIVQSISQIFKSSTSSEVVAAEAVAEAEKAVAEAETAMRNASVVGEAGVEVEETSGMMKMVGNTFKVLGAVGLVVTLIVGIVEAVQGAEQKSKLIDAIHGCQPSRLCIAYFKREATNIIQQLALMQTYLITLTGPNKDEIAAEALGTLIVDNIKSENSRINWDTLEAELEAQDKTFGNYYGDDDLSASVVVAKAKANPTG